ncbi:hypothetical protein LXJ58_30395, partial [Escherichia coli]|nr:hypothetical protein [Escherichia coli]
MYADRYARPTRFSPTGLTAAVAINAALVAALIFAAPHVLPTPPADGPLDTYTVPSDPPPPPPTPQPEPHEKSARVPDEVIVAPRPDVPVIRDTIVPTVDPTFAPPTYGDRIGADPVVRVDPGP